MKRVISDEQAAAVVEGYMAGERVARLANRLGMPVSSVYWVLERSGVSPSRAKRKQRLATEDAGELLDALAEQEELIQALEAEIVELRNQLRRWESGATD